MGRDVPKSLNLSLNDLIGIEKRWFSIYSKTDSLEKQEELRLAGNSALTGDLIYSCLKSLALNASNDQNDEPENIDDEVDTNVLSSNIFSDIYDGKNSRLLNIAVQESRLY